VCRFPVPSCWIGHGGGGGSAAQRGWRGVPRERVVAAECRVALLVGVLLVVALVAYVVTHWHSTSSTTPHATSAASRTGTGPLLAANDVLLPGLSSASSVNKATGHISFTAELINASQANLTVAYPIRVPGATHVAVSVLYAELAAPTSSINQAEPPARLTRIAAHEHVVLWIGLHIQCAHRARPPSWPTARSRLAISLTGFPAPATFTFGDLFDPDGTSQILQMCPSAIHPGQWHTEMTPGSGAPRNVPSRPYDCPPHPAGRRAQMTKGSPASRT
jgi:hypothetical protein